VATVPATWDQVLARRVAAHRLDVPATDGLVPLVRRLCGLHAQLASAAEAAVWPRTGGAFGPDDVRTALADDRTLVKTWAMRGTLHLLPAADLPTWTAALGTRSFPRPRSWYAYHGATPEDMALLEATVPGVLTATPMSREQLAAAVVAESGQVHLEPLLLSGWGALLKPMAARGQLAFGPPDGRTVTFVAPQAWVGKVGAGRPGAGRPERRAGRPGRVRAVRAGGAAPLVGAGQAGAAAGAGGAARRAGRAGRRGHPGLGHRGGRGRGGRGRSEPGGAAAAGLRSVRGGSAAAARPVAAVAGAEAGGLPGPPRPSRLNTDRGPAGVPAGPRVVPGLRARGPSGDPPAGGRPTRPRSRPDRRAHRARCPDPRPLPAPGPGTP